MGDVLTVPAGKGTIPDIGGTLPKDFVNTRWTKHDTIGVVLLAGVASVSVKCGVKANVTVAVVSVENTFLGIVSCLGDAAWLVSGCIPETTSIDVEGCTASVDVSRPA